MKKVTYKLIEEEYPELCEKCFVEKYGREPNYWELAYSGDTEIQYGAYAASLHRCKICGE